MGISKAQNLIRKIMSQQNYRLILANVRQEHTYGMLLNEQTFQHDMEFKKKALPCYPIKYVRLVTAEAKNIEIPW